MKLSCTWLLVIAFTLAACGGGGGARSETPDGGTQVSAAEVPRVPLNAEASRVYLSQIAPLLSGRELTVAELGQIELQAETAIAPIIEGWTREEGFVEAMRMLIQKKLSLSGTRDGVDFELPGNLAAYIAKNKLGIRTLLTADYCVSAAGEKIECDTGAPFKAGVVVTRAYLRGRASRFNLTRASTLLNAFACRHYPMESTLQPPLERTSLIPMFQAQTAAEQTDPRATTAFGNGTACYSCHGQFSAHAQLFVKFDSTGIWRSEATGLQDPSGELGRSVNGLYASHLKDQLLASEERSQVFGKAVANLAEGAKAIAENPAYLECQSRNVLEFVLRVDPSAHVSETLLAEIGKRASALNADPTFADIVISTFSHAEVIDAVIANIGGMP
ncbi:MAG: hypothetical protein ACT4TC_20470 [Myxococcaceae bacterium]